MDHIQITKEERLVDLKHIKMAKFVDADLVHPRNLWEAGEEIMESCAGMFSNIYGWRGFRGIRGKWNWIRMLPCLACKRWTEEPTSLLYSSMTVRVNKL